MIDMDPMSFLKAKGAFQELRVDRDLSGGVRVALSDCGFVLSPEDAIRFGSAILKAAGCNVDYQGDPLTKRTLRL
jgi:hypothetical protein